MLLFALLFVSSLYLASCAQIQIPELHPAITLPASGDGFLVDTVTGESQTIPAAEWQKKLPRGIILFSDDWEKLKTTLLTNCMENSCKQAVGVLDTLFQTIDKALKKIPVP